MKSIIFAILTIAVAHAQRCGPSTAANGSSVISCPSGFCCSAAGFCGNTEMHCGPGCTGGSCKEAPVPSSFNLTTTSVCSPNGPFCPSNMCCSASNFCGSSPTHCGDGCTQGNCTSGFKEPRNSGNRPNNSGDKNNNSGDRSFMGQLSLTAFVAGAVAFMQ